MQEKNKHQIQKETYTHTTIKKKRVKTSEHFYVKTLQKNIAKHS